MARRPGRPRRRRAARGPGPRAAPRPAGCRAGRGPGSAGPEVAGEGLDREAGRQPERRRSAEGAGGEAPTQPASATRRSARPAGAAEAASGHARGRVDTPSVDHSLSIRDPTRTGGPPPLPHGPPCRRRRTPATMPTRDRSADRSHLARRRGPGASPVGGRSVRRPLRPGDRGELPTARRACARSSSATSGPQGIGLLISSTSPKWEPLSSGRYELLLLWLTIRRQYRVRGTRRAHARRARRALLEPEGSRIPTARPLLRDVRRAVEHRLVARAIPGGDRRLAPALSHARGGAPAGIAPRASTSCPTGSRCGGDLRIVSTTDAALFGSRRLARGDPGSVARSGRAASAAAPSAWRRPSRKPRP